MPLYNKEIYYIVRADAEWNFVHEIANARINAGEMGSGTALTSATLYRLMFDRDLPVPGTTYVSNEEALVKLITDKSIDVVTVVAGQPAKLLVDMKPEARQLIKLLKVDPDHPSTQAALKTYFSATVRASSYPSLLTDDLPALAVKAFLVTYDFNRRGAGEHLRRFAQSLCSNFPALREKGHSKWREVDLMFPARARSRMELLLAHRARVARLRGEGPASGRPGTIPSRPPRHAAGADPGPLQVASTQRMSMRLRVPRLSR